MVIGGAIGSAVFVPFTISHGPTSVNIENEVLGWDMHNWGFLMGTIPPLLIGAGLWSVRTHLAGGRRVAFDALSVMCLAMFLFGATNAVFRAIAPPFDLFLLAPASLVATATARQVASRIALGVISAAYWAALAMALLPEETSDSISGYRIFGSIAYVGVGVLWATFGLALLATDRLRGIAE